MTAGFSHRPLGTRAVREASAAGHSEAVLRLDEASVRVGDIRQERDGSFRGTIRAIEPHGLTGPRGIATGDEVAFRASHVFVRVGWHAEAPKSAARGTRSRSTAQDRSVERAERRQRRALLASAAFTLFAAGAALGYFLGTTKESPSVSKEWPAKALAQWRLKVDNTLKSR